MAIDRTNLDAPHGYDDDGQPLTPYGLKSDGRPRLSNRGARAGARPASKPRSTGRKPLGRAGSTDKARKDMLLTLTDLYVVGGLVTAATLPPVVNLIGEPQAMALAGDAYLVDQLAPEVIDAVIVASQTRPGLLSWLDTVEDKAPFLMLATVGIKILTAITMNHMNPNENMAAAGVAVARAKMTKFAENVQAENARMAAAQMQEEPAA